MYEGCDPIRLTVPLDEAYARMVRLLAASLAQLCGFDIDRVDDVKLAAEEAFLLAIAMARPSEPVEITIEQTNRGLRLVLVGLDLASDDQAVEDERYWRYGLFVLEAVADEVGFVANGDTTDLEIVIASWGGT